MFSTQLKAQTSQVKSIATKGLPGHEQLHFNICMFSTQLKAHCHKLSGAQLPWTQSLRAKHMHAR